MTDKNKFHDSCFDGVTYHPENDAKRLVSCLQCVKAVMSSCEWLTLTEIQSSIECFWGKHYALTGISARIRDLRKIKFGGFSIEHRRRDHPSQGLFEYRLLPAETFNGQ